MAEPEGGAGAKGSSIPTRVGQSPKGGLNANVKDQQGRLIQKITISAFSFLNSLMKKDDPKHGVKSTI